MQNSLAAAVLAALLLLPATLPARGAEDAAPASVRAFYGALSGAPGSDVTALLTEATAPEWVSCAANDVCRGRDDVIAAIVTRRREIPDLTWRIREVLVAGDRVIVRGEASGTPIGDFMGVPHSGKSFRLMSIDIHTLQDGRLARSYHVEDWAGAVRQLAAK